MSREACQVGAVGAGDGTPRAASPTGCILLGLVVEGAEGFSIPMGSVGVGSNRRVSSSPRGCDGHWAPQGGIQHPHGCGARGGRADT